MTRKAEIVTAVATFGCAIGVGFWMQSTEIAEQRYGPKAVDGFASDAMPITDTSSHVQASTDQTPEVSDAEQVTLTSASIIMPDTKVSMAAAATQPDKFGMDKPGQSQGPTERVE